MLDLGTKLSALLDRARGDPLPDSRLRDRSKGVVRGLLPGVGMVNWVPIFCAHCGVPNGYVPEENIDFVCWFCDRCAEKHGHLIDLAMIPDEIFWQKAHHEQIERYGRLLSLRELLEVVDDGSSPLAKLIRDKR